MTRRIRRWAAALPALLLLLAAGRCAAPNPSPASGPEADALSALVEHVAARARADTVGVQSAPAYTRERIPADVWARIAGMPRMDPTTLANFERRNAAPAPLPPLHPAGVILRDSAGPGTLALRLSPAGISAAGDQLVVIAESACGAGCVSGEAFLLVREGGRWRVAQTVTLFVS